jgi:hypothetical protein
MPKKANKRFTTAEQSARFREAAKEAGLDARPKALDEAMKKVAKLKYATYTKSKK